MNHLRKINVLFVCESLGPGGREKVLMDMLQAIDHDRCCVTVCTLCDANIYEAELRGIPIRVVSLHMPTTTLRMSRNVPLLLGLCRVIRTTSPDILQTQGPDADFYGQLLGTLMGVRTIITMVHGEDVFRNAPWSATWKHRIKMHTQLWAFRLADHVIAVSDTTRKFVEDKLGVPARKVRVVRNGIIPLNRVLARPAAKEKFGIPQDAPVVGYVGRLSSEKNVASLILAFDFVRREIPEARLVLVGTGVGAETLAQFVRETNLEDAVWFAGEHRSVQSYLEMMDVFVLPSFTEGLPLVLLEAMSLGTSVVASCVGGIPEIVDGGRNGLLVPAPDSTLLAHAVRRGSVGVEPDPRYSRDLAAAMLRLLRDGAFAADIGDRAARFVREHCAVSSNVQQLQSLYVECSSHVHRSGVV